MERRQWIRIKASCSGTCGRMCAWCQNGPGRLRQAAGAGLIQCLVLETVGLEALNVIHWSGGETTPKSPLLISAARPELGP